MGIFELYATRLWRWGSSWCIPFPRPLREAMGWRPGDLVLMRPHLPYITMRVARPETAVPDGAMDPELMPPAWPRAGGEQQ